MFKIMALNTCTQPGTPMMNGFVQIGFVDHAMLNR